MTLREQRTLLVAQTDLQIDVPQVLSVPWWGQTKVLGAVHFRWATMTEPVGIFHSYSGFDRVLQCQHGCDLFYTKEIAVDRETKGQDMVPTDAISNIAGHERLQLLKYLCSPFAFVSPCRARVCIHACACVVRVYVDVCASLGPGSGCPEVSDAASAVCALLGCMSCDFEQWCWRRLLRVPWLQGDPTSPS